MDSMNVLQDASSTLNNAATEFIDLSNRVTNLENITLSSSTTTNIDRRISQLEQAFAANQALFNNTQAVMGLINQNYDLVRAIINNQTSVEVTYNLDVLRQGPGVLLDRSTPNQVVITNASQDFNMVNTLGVGTFTQNGDNTIELLTFSNYYKHVNNSTPLTLTGDLTIRIDDSKTNWKNGQRFRLSFGDEIFPGNYIINIVTNALGKYPISNPTTSAYSTIIVSLDDTVFLSQEYEPVFDIVCIDEDNLKFQVDVIGKSLTNNQ
jgi:hypothetical protein